MLEGTFSTLYVPSSSTDQAISGKCFLGGGKKTLNRYCTNSERQFSRNVVFRYIIILSSKVGCLRYEETGSSFTSVLVVYQNDLKLFCWVSKRNTQQLMDTSSLVLPCLAFSAPLLFRFHCATFFLDSCWVCYFICLKVLLR